MKTLIIETTEPSKRIEIDLDNESADFAGEIETFVSKLEARSGTKRKSKSVKLSPKLRVARAYLDSIASRPESREALAEADRLRQAWIRDNG